MPVTKCALDDVERCVTELESAGKIVTQLAITGGAVVVLYHARPKRGRPPGSGAPARSRETRPANEDERHAEYRT